MATWESYRIADIVSEIENDRFVLPVIQRRLVWEEEKMELLFDTVLKGNSFGGIMVIEEEVGTKPLFSYRSFTKDGNPINSRQIDRLHQSQFFVIDGQQRLQSFYIGLKGSINNKIMYFDLYSDWNNREFDFKFEGDYSKLPKQAKDAESRPIKAHSWYRVSQLLQRLKDTDDEDQIADEIIRQNNLTEDIFKTHVRKNVRAFHKNIINARCIGISKVSINKDLDEVANKQRIVELFRRLNDGGTKLSSFDLVASILKGFEWEMEKFLDQTLKEFSDIGLDQENLIKLIFLLQDNHKKEMVAIEASDAQFAINNRERISITLKCLKNFLIHSDLYNYYKDGNRSFIPLFFVAYHIFHNSKSNSELLRVYENYDTNNHDFWKVYKWVYHSLLNGVFKSRGAGWIPYSTGIRKILETVKGHKNQEFPIIEIFSVYRSHPIVFTTDYNKHLLDQLDSTFLYYLIYDRKQTIRQQDIDHIHPKSLLEPLGFGWDKINSIANYQLLDVGTNRGEKNAKQLSYWIENYVADKPFYLNKHGIPVNEELWTESEFDRFLDERSALIFEKIKKYLLIQEAVLN